MFAHVCSFFPMETMKVLGDGRAFEAIQSVKDKVPPELARGMTEKQKVVPWPWQSEAFRIRNGICVHRQKREQQKLKSCNRWKRKPDQFVIDPCRHHVLCHS